MDKKWIDVAAVLNKLLGVLHVNFDDTHFPIAKEITNKIHYVDKYQKRIVCRVAEEILQRTLFIKNVQMFP